MPPTAVESAAAPVWPTAHFTEPFSLLAVDSTWKHSFQRELDIAIKLQHPNVIEIYDVIFWDRSAQPFACPPTRCIASALSYRVQATNFLHACDASV